MNFVDDGHVFVIAKAILARGRDDVDYELAELAIAALAEQARTGVPHSSFAPLILLGKYEDEFVPEERPA